MSSDDWRERAAEAIARGAEPEWDDLGEVDERERARFAELAAIAGSFAVASATLRGEPAASEPVLFTWGPLRVIGKLGEGSFAEVFRAWDPALERTVALKLRRSQPAEPHADDAAHEFTGGRRYLDEGRRLARVRHPHVLAVHGAAVEDGRVGVWSELIEGETLEAVLAREGPLDPSAVAAALHDLASALAALHAAGLVHGDVKTTNVMRERSGRLVLMDLGAAREIGGPRHAALEGTPAAMAPELFAGEPPAPASDLWSLGALGFRLLTGRYPIAAESWDELARRHERGEQSRLGELRPDLPSALVASVERALAPRPGERFATADEMAQVLADFVEPPGTAPDSAGERAAPKLRRWRWATALTTTAAVLAVGFALAVALRRGGVAGAGAPPRLALLPLHTAAAGIDDGWIAPALGELLRGSLAAGDVVRVASAEEVERMGRDFGLAPRGDLAAEQIARIGRNLDVDWLVDGKLDVPADRDELRLSLRLLRSTTGEVLAVVERRGPRGDLLALADGAAGGVRSALHLPPPAGLDAAARLPPPGAARQAYVQGLTYLRRFEAREAAAKLRLATSLAPDFALGWLALSRAEARRGDEAAATAAAREAFSRAALLPAAERRSTEANYLSLTGENDRAATLLAENVAARPGDPEALLEAANTALTAERTEDVLALVAPFLERTPDNRLDPRLLLVASRASELAGEVDRCLAYAERAERIATAREAPTLAAEALLRQATALLNQGALREADERDRLQRARTLADRVGDPMLSLRIDWALGLVDRYAGSRDPTLWLTAAATWESALARARSLGARNAERALLGNLARLAFDRGEITEMIRHLEAYLALCSELRSPTCRTSIAGTAGQGFAYGGDLARARQLSQEGLETARGQMPTEEASNLSNLADLELHADRPAEAERLFRQAFDLWRSRGSNRGVLWAEVDVAMIVVELGRGETYASRLGEIVDDPQAKAEPFLQGYARTQLARIALSRGDLPAADRESARAVELAPLPYWPAISYPAVQVRAQVLMARGARSAARELQVRARDTAAAKGVRLAELEASIALAELEGGATGRALLARLAAEARGIGDLALARRADTARHR